MPFRIIRDDITRVSADAIVNTANPMPVYADGTDHAIYMAAGADELLAERKKIGAISRGEAAVTKAFRLPARFIIHTVGPVWQGGDHGEFETLRSCYRKSLLLAEQLGCQSIAFPLISTGIYGFPRDKALEIALSCFREHLTDSEMEITLVVFDRGSVALSASLVDEVEQFILSFCEGAGIIDIFLTDIGQVADMLRQLHAGVDEEVLGLHDVAAVHADRAEFNDPVMA